MAQLPGYSIRFRSPGSNRSLYSDLIVFDVMEARFSIHIVTAGRYLSPEAISSIAESFDFGG